MSIHSDMPESWSRNAARGSRSAEITAAIVRAREARAGSATPQETPAPPARVDELAQRRSARQAAAEARRRMLPTDPPGPRTA